MEVQQDAASAATIKKRNRSPYRISDTPRLVMAGLVDLIKSPGTPRRTSAPLPPSSPAAVNANTTTTTNLMRKTSAPPVHYHHISPTVARRISNHYELYTTVVTNTSTPSSSQSTSPHSRRSSIISSGAVNPIVRVQYAHPDLIGHTITANNSDYGSRSYLSSLLLLHVFFCS